MAVKDWSTTAANNDDADSAINWAEGQAPSTVNNSARAMMAEIAKWFGDTDGTLTTTGSSNAYAVTTNNGYTAYFDGLPLVIEANHTNTGAATINVDTIGAANIKLTDGTDPYADAIQSGGRYFLSYDGTNFQLLNPTTEVIGQSEAEAGTATTPRLWTAERVRQAIDSGVGPIATATPDGSGVITILEDAIPDVCQLILVLEGIIPANDGTDVTMQIKFSGAWRTSAYTYALTGLGDGGGALTNSSVADSAIEITNGGSAVGGETGEGLNGEIVWTHPGTSLGIHPMCRIHTEYRSTGGGGTFINGFGRYGSSGAIQGVRFQTTGASNIASGTVRAYARLIN